MHYAFIKYNMVSAYHFSSFGKSKVNELGLPTYIILVLFRCLKLNYPVNTNSFDKKRDPLKDFTSWTDITRLTLYLPVSSADNFCKTVRTLGQARPFVGPDLDPNC